MPTLADVRSMQVQFQAQCKKLVLRGTGDPNPSLGSLDSIYLNQSTSPPTVWMKTRSGWVKAQRGATV